MEVNQLFDVLSRRKAFAKVDLTQTWQQMAIDDITADVQTMITHHRTFQA